MHVNNLYFQLGKLFADSHFVQHKKCSKDGLGRKLKIDHGLEIHEKMPFPQGEAHFPNFHRSEIYLL